VSIHLLTAREESLVSRLEHFRESGELDRQSVIRAIQHEFETIYLSYVSLLKEHDRPLEALKRAVFLQWYAFIEPFHITGAGQLPDEEQQFVMEQFERAREEGWVDEEAIYMLHWYFDKWASQPSLGQLLGESHRAIDLTKHLSTTELARRGMMGQYFDEMAKGQIETANDPGMELWRLE
jgi:hypothetical protein